ncbi:hypothetical protein T05_12218, partial [Trichinella murrelli]
NGLVKVKQQQSSNRHFPKPCSITTVHCTQADKIKKQKDVPKYRMQSRNQAINAYNKRICVKGLNRIGIECGKSKLFEQCNHQKLNKLRKFQVIVPVLANLDTTVDLATKDVQGIDQLLAVLQSVQ